MAPGGIKDKKETETLEQRYFFVLLSLYIGLSRGPKTDEFNPFLGRNGVNSSPFLCLREGKKSVFALENPDFFRFLV